MTPAEEDAIVAKAVAGISNFEGSEWTDSIRLAIRAAVAQERDQWTSPKTVHAIAQHLKGYQPFSDENVRVMLDDISNGIEDRAAAIRRGEE